MKLFNYRLLYWTLRKAVYEISVDYVTQFRILFFGIFIAGCFGTLDIRIENSIFNFINYLKYAVLGVGFSLNSDVI